MLLVKSQWIDTTTTLVHICDHEKFVENNFKLDYNMSHEETQRARLEFLSNLCDAWEVKYGTEIYIEYSPMTEMFVKYKETDEDNNNI